MASSSASEPRFCCLVFVSLATTSVMRRAVGGVDDVVLVDGRLGTGGLRRPLAVGDPDVAALRDARRGRDRGVEPVGLRVGGGPGHAVVVAPVEPLREAGALDREVRRPDARARLRGARNDEVRLVAARRGEDRASWSTSLPPSMLRWALRTELPPLAACMHVTRIVPAAVTVIHGLSPLGNGRPRRACRTCSALRPPSRRRARSPTAGRRRCAEEIHVT